MIKRLREDKILRELLMVIATGFACPVLIILAVCYADQIDKFFSNLVLHLLK